MADYLSSDDPDTVLNKMTAVDQVGRQQRAIITRLQVARNQQANRVAAAQATKRHASLATRGAADRKNDAISSAAQIRRQLADEQQRRTTLVRQRNGIQKQLTELRGAAARRSAWTPPPPVRQAAHSQVPATSSTGCSAPTTHPSKWRPTPPRNFSSTPVSSCSPPSSGSSNCRVRHCSTRLGLGGANLGSSGPNSIVSRLQTGSAAPLFGSSGGRGGGVIRPGLRGPQAVEIVVNRALSQLNVPYAWGGGGPTAPPRASATAA